MRLSASESAIPVGPLGVPSEGTRRAWIYNQIGDNLTGILIILFGLGLWRALSPDVLGRIGAGAVMLTGLTAFLEGFLRLDCRGIDGGCTNDSWHSSAHKMNNRFLTAAILAALLILAFGSRSGATCGFRRSSLCPPRWPWAFSSAASATVRRNALRTSRCSSGSGS
jgi:hypothetical protein